MNLLPFPRKLRRESGIYALSPKCALYLRSELSPTEVMLPIAERLQRAASFSGVDLELITGVPNHPRLAIKATPFCSVSPRAEEYRLRIGKRGVTLEYSDLAGLRAGAATLAQIIREYGRRLPCLRILDYPDFPRRGVMLDVSRGRVPRLETLLELVDHLAGFKINEFQLYTEHTFAYRFYEPVWKDWGALTGQEILRLDQRCKELGIDLVPNQNSFGHLRYWLEHAPLRPLAEVAEPYEGTGGAFLRYPTTLAPTNPQTLKLLRTLYDELLPYFSSRYFNVGCDETWDLGRGQSKRRCERLGKGRVYLDFLKTIDREVSRRGKKMMFWGDIILHHPELIPDLPPDVTAMNWGYEADHPFQQETALFARSGVRFYVCPGTSTWMTLIGRHDNAFSNLQSAAQHGQRAGASGYLNTDWGDGGHPQPMAVSYLPYLVGASVSWCRKSYDEQMLCPVLSREVFQDSTGNAAKAAHAMGHAHRWFNYYAPNVTPFGTVLTAPPPALRELVCRDGLKYFARIPMPNIAAASSAVEAELHRLSLATPVSESGRMLLEELRMAGQMAVESCNFMLWQKAVTEGRRAAARAISRLAKSSLVELRAQFNDYWPLRNKGPVEKCAAFLDWRLADYECSRVHFTPEQARQGWST